VAIALGLLTPITLLMGGTLTLLIRYLVRADVEAQTRRIALLYAVNTAGAAVGCFLTDFTFVPAWGLLDTQLIAVALNAIAGVGAIALAAGRKSQIPNPKSQTPRKRERESRIPNPESRPATPVAWVAMALALSGFAALGMEILWFRHFSIMLGAFRAVFSLLLTVILVGIGAGALIASALQRRVKSPGALLIAMQSLFVVFTLAGMWRADSSVIDRTVSNAVGAFGATTAIDQLALPTVWNELWFNLRPMLLEVALPALLMGFGFPLGNVLIQRVEQSVGQRAGVLYLANTAGAVAGSLVAGFVLLPLLGLQTSTTILLAAAAIGLVPLYLVVRLKPSAFRRTFPVLLAVASLIAWMLLPSDYVSTRALPRPEPNERVLNQSEGVNEIVTVTETSGKGRRLMTNGHAMSATWPLSQRYMRALAHVPLLMRDNPARVLVIGFGVGNTTAAATLHPSIQRVEVADLSRNVLDHASWFGSTNGNVLRDPRVSVYLNDGRHHLQMQPPGSYDLVTLEPPPIGYAG
jgi:predicted membrane-bound spermidine synthase